MAFRQAKTTLIRTADFRNNTISFPIESVLGIGQGTGELTISVSAGYVLTTSVNTSPQPQQVISYVLQPNGTHVAHTVVTLLATDLPAINGTVTLRNPLGETTLLPIDAQVDTDLTTNRPVLTLSTETLTFAKTQPGEEEYALLKVSQQGTDTLVTLTSDDPANFLLAVGVEELRFTSTLSFMPPPGGVFVHVRYAPDRSGQHTGRLFVETSFDTKTVLLRGRAAGLLPALPQRAPKPNRATQPVYDAQPATSGSLWRAIAVVLIASLAGLGYVYRCQIAPELCQSQASAIPVAPREPSAKITPTKPVEKPSTAGRHPDNTELTVSGKSRSMAKRKEPAQPTESKSIASEQNEVVLPPQAKSKAARETKKVSATPEESESISARPTRKRVKTAVVPAAPPTDESDLEKELNKKVDKP